MASRFALLNPEVDLDERLGKKKETKPKPETLAKKTQNKNNANKKKKNDNESLQNLAFGNPKSKNKKKNKTSNGHNGNKENSNHGVIVDDDWKQRDDQFIETENERSLHEAIFASKLDYEEKKDVYAMTKKDTVEEKTKGGKIKKKKDKVTIPLDLFNSLKPNQLAELNNGSPASERLHASPEPLPTEETFFDDVDKATKSTIEKENRHKNYQATAGQFSAEIKAVEYVEEIEKRDYEIQALKYEVVSLKEDLMRVKCRNKTLCEVISVSEMKSKGELAVELQNANKAHDEFSQEITKLSAELEQEKTKVSQLQNEHRKNQGKKKHNNDSSSKE